MILPKCLMVHFIYNYMTTNDIQNNLSLVNYIFNNDRHKWENLLKKWYIKKIDENRYLIGHDFSFRLGYGVNNIMTYSLTPNYNIEVKNFLIQKNSKIKDIDDKSLYIIPHKIIDLDKRDSYFEYLCNFMSCVDKENLMKYDMEKFMIYMLNFNRRSDLYYQRKFANGIYD